jgi:hypothetical protein
LNGPAGALGPAGAPRPDGFAVASNASENPTRAINRPIKTRTLKKADCEVDFFFMSGFLDEWSLKYGAFLLPKTPEMCQHLFRFLFFAASESGTADEV